MTMFVGECILGWDIEQVLMDEVLMVMGGCPEGWHWWVRIGKAPTVVCGFAFAALPTSPGVLHSARHR